MELSVLLDPRESVVLLEFGKSVIRAPCVGCGAGRRDGRESDVADVSHLVSTERDNTNDTNTKKALLTLTLTHTNERVSVWQMVQGTRLCESNEQQHEQQRARSEQHTTTTTRAIATTSLFFLFFLVADVAALLQRARTT